MSRESPVTSLCFLICSVGELFIQGHTASELELWLKLCPGTVHSLLNKCCLMHGLRASPRVLWMDTVQVLLQCVLQIWNPLFYVWTDSLFCREGKVEGTTAKGIRPSGSDSFRTPCLLCSDFHSLWCRNASFASLCWCFRGILTLLAHRNEILLLQ